MKTLFTLAAVFISINLFANPDKVYSKLVEVNSYWKQQDDISQLIYPEYSEKTDREWIRTHLQLLEQVLRSRNTAHLNAQQKANRLAALQHLNIYWHAGNFPINDKYTYRTPIFIDNYDNFCAVGYLVKATGHEEVSRMIAEDNNLGYVEDMHYSELLAWADEYGFTKEELAWIQPSYGAITNVQPLGKGTNGAVYELFVDGSGNNLYVGGVFSEVDSSISANNIAYVTESGGIYTWHNMGAGVNGRVNAITEHDGKIFVAGSFDTAGTTLVSNVAYWENGIWHNAGCLYGVVNDLKSYNGELYAVGDFDVCAALADINFAKWDTTFNSWQQLPGLSGHINTLEIINGTFYLGGRFSYLNDTVNMISYQGGSGYTKFNNSIDNEVMDITSYKNEIYAGVKRYDLTKTDTLLYKLNNNEWLSALYDSVYYLSNTFTAAYNSILGIGDTLYMSGYYWHNIMGRPKHSRIYNSQYNFTTGDVYVDSTIHKSVFFKNNSIIGGEFGTGHFYTMGDLNPTHVIKTLGGIARRAPRDFLTIEYLPQEYKLILTIAPNPAHRSITIQNNFNATFLQLYSLEGRLIKSYTLENSEQQISLPELATGTYLLQIADKDGRKATERLLIN